MTPAAILRTVQGCTALVIFGVVFWLGGVSQRAEFADYRARVDREDAARAKKSYDRRMEVLRRHAEDLAEVANQYEQDKKKNEDTHNALVADLRAGNKRLHDRWQADKATARLSGAVASAAESDAAARDREESASRIVRAADEADAQIRRLQDVIRADRK